MIDHLLSTARAVLYTSADAIEQTDRDPYVLAYCEALQRLTASFLRQTEVPDDLAQLAESFVDWAEAMAQGLAHERTTGGADSPELAQQISSSAERFFQLSLAHQTASTGGNGTDEVDGDG